MRIERFIFQIFLLVDKTRQVEQKNTRSTIGRTLGEEAQTGSTNENSLSRPEVRRLIKKWTQPSYKGEQAFRKISNFSQILFLSEFETLKRTWF